jgi:hypothetical protein
MKRAFTMTCLFSLLTLAAVAALAAEHEHAMASPSLGGLETLVGHWQGKTPKGDVIHASYELVGTALMERLEMAKEGAMLTVYHRDGDGLMMTHYCSMGNQPRMRASDLSDPKSLKFAYVDATNLSAPGAPHMHALEIHRVDKDHISESWTMMADGKGKTEQFDLHRVK